jgi:hypothetical protein
MANVTHRLHAKVTMADGQVYAAVIDERDLRRWDLTFKAKGWPSKNEAEFLYQGFIAASALARGGDTARPLEAILNDIVSVDIEADETVPPTGPEPGNG